MDIQAIKEFAKAIRRTAVEMAYNTRTSHTGGTMSQADVLATSMRSYQKSTSRKRYSLINKEY